MSLTPDFVLGYRAVMLDGIAREAEITKKVIAAVPDAKSDYRPDPNARTAKELAWHIANTDIQFLDGIAALNFAMEDITASRRPSSQMLEFLSELYNSSNRESDYCSTLLKLFDLYCSTSEFPKAAECLDRAAEVDPYEPGHLKRLDMN